MHWVYSVWVASGHYRAAVAVAVGAYYVWRKLPWWIAAMRAATTNDDAKAKRAREAMQVIEPHWYWPWQRQG